MMTETPVRTFEITPSGRFSLERANGFGFGQRDAVSGPRMALAFATDGDFEPAGVELAQSADGTVHGRVQGDADLEAVRGQVARILSLDGDGEAWAALLRREAPLGRIEAEVPGLRPVLFHSPYEGAAWSVISARIQRAQAAKIRADLSRSLGTVYTLHGQELGAFPSPAALLAGLESWGGSLPAVKRERLLAVAEAAEDGLFDVPGLLAAGPKVTAERMQTVPGIGPFYASLIAVRSTGFTDAFTVEPRAKASALDAYGLPETATDAEWAELTDRWRPFRTWASVLMRVRAERGIR